MKQLLFLFLILIQTTSLFSTNENGESIDFERSSFSIFTDIPFINSTDTSLGEIIVCDNEPFVIDGDAYFNTGSFEVTIESSQSGCDSVISFSILNITPVAIIDGISVVSCTNDIIELNASSSIVNMNAINTFLWTRDGLFYDDSEFITASSGFFELTVVSTIGNVVCSHTTAFEVPISPVFTPMLNGELDTLCTQDCTTIGVQPQMETYAYLWENDATTIDITVCPEVTTTYFVTVTDNSGCQQIASTIVNVNPIGIFEELNAQICIGDTLDISIYNEYVITLSSPELAVIDNNNLLGLNSGVIDIILTDQDGCLQPNTNLFVTILECEPDCISKDTTVIAEICAGDSIYGYGETGVYADTFNLGEMCDSVVFIELSILPSYHDSIIIGLCFGESYNGISENSIIIDTFQSTFGCDSIINSIITISSLISDTLVIDICDGEDYEGYMMSGSYTDTLQASFGCDSIVVLDLTVIPVVDTSIFITICEGEEYNGQIESGQYQNIIESTLGCDSIVTINLEVIPIINNNISITICEGEEYEGYTAMGIYQNTFESILGCDSTITLDLTVVAIDRDTIDVAVCEGFSFLGYSEQGQYIDTTFSQEGCTELRILNLEIIDSVFIEFDTLICPGDTIMGTAIFDEGSYSFEGLSAQGCPLTTLISVQLKDEGCSVGTDDFDENMLVLFYPNPTKEIVNIESDMSFHISLYDSNGIQIISRQHHNTKTRLDLSFLENGIYIAKLESKDKQLIKRIVKID